MLGVNGAPFISVSECIANCTEKACIANAPKSTGKNAKNAML